MIKQSGDLLEIDSITSGLQISIETSKSSEVAETANTFLQTVNCMDICNPEVYESAGVQLRGIKKFATTIEAERKKITAPLDAAKKAVMDLFRKPTEDLKVAKTIVEGSMLRYRAAEEKKRQAKEKKLQEAAEREEEKKRKALEKRADNWEAKGKTDKAEGLRDEAESVHVPRPITPPTVNSGEGESVRENWSAEVVDLKALIKAVVDGQAPTTCIQANMTVLNSQARNLKGTMTYPGVKFVCSKSIVNR